MTIHPLTTKAVVLQLLLRGPNYNGALVALAQEITNGRFVTYFENVKIALRDLSNDELIARCSGPQRKGGCGKKRVYYTLTARGRLMAEEHRQLVQIIFLGVVSNSTPSPKGHAR